MLHPMECANEIKKELHRCAAICQGEFGWGPFPLQLDWTVRGTVAGKALQDKRVRFNLMLLREQPIDQIRMVAAHEFAHIAVYKRWAQDVLNDFRTNLWKEVSFNEVAFLSDPDLSGQRPNAHGPEWRRMMLLFGYLPTRCHSFDVSRHRMR